MLTNHARRWMFYGAACLAVCSTGLLCSTGLAADRPTLKVPSCEHFQVNGRGDAEAWSKAPWQEIKLRPGGAVKYQTRFKMLYSDQGIYVLFDAEDRVLTSSMQADFLHLWEEDVFECFFWTDERYPLYFEYEISPLGYELPILVPNLDGQIRGWRPWDYDEKKTEKAVFVSGGEQKSEATVTGWRAEVFFPYTLFSPLTNVPPKPGDTWRANFYRMDYDQKARTQWDWARVGPSFHEFKKFGTVEFE